MGGDPIKQGEPKRYAFRLESRLRRKGKQNKCLSLLMECYGRIPKLHYESKRGGTEDLVDSGQGRALSGPGTCHCCPPPPQPHCNTHISIVHSWGGGAANRTFFQSLSVCKHKERVCFCEYEKRSRGGMLAIEASYLRKKKKN
jgi:hypothetical protein